MDALAAAGCVSLGLLIGALVGWYISEAKRMSKKELSSSISVLTGGGISALFAYLTAGPRVTWLYPVGLLAGFLLVTGVELYYYDYYGEPRKGGGQSKPVANPSVPPSRGG